MTTEQNTIRTAAQRLSAAGHPGYGEGFAELAEEIHARGGRSLAGAIAEAYRLWFWDPRSKVTS